MKRSPRLPQASRTGGSLIEIIVAMALVSVFSVAFLQLALGSRDSGQRGLVQTEAVAYARQGLEAARSVARRDFALLNAGDYGIGVVSGVYAFSGATNVSGRYARTVTVELVRRDAGGTIVQSGGGVDYDTRRVTSTVRWMQGSSPRQVTLTSLFTNWRKIIPAGLTVQKIVVNHGSTKVAADFAPYLVGTGTVTLGQAVEINPGTYAVSENLLPGYAQEFSGDCNASGQITLVSRDAKTCTITNEELAGSVTVQKTVVNYGGTKTAVDFAPYKVGTTTVTLGAATNFPNGTYTVSETVDAGYARTFGGDCNAVGSVTVTTGSAKTCTITNVQQAGSVTVTATVLNHGGNKTAADFAPYKVGPTTVTLGAATTVANGTYTVSAGTDAGYTRAFGGDCDSAGSVTVGTGQARACSITYEQIVAATGTVTVQKTVINHGSAKTAADFAPYKVGTATVTLGAPSTVNAGAYAVTETADPAYTQTFGGDCDAAGSVTVTGGGAKTCTITNEEKTSGVFVYGNGTTTPQHRLYNRTLNSFTSAAGATAGSNGAGFVLRASPTKREAIAGYVTSAGVLQILCYDGASWTNEWSVTVGGTSSTRRFDIAYETATGDAIVLYSRNAATTNELAYRTKPGSAGCGSANWAAAANLDPVRTSGIVHWVKMAWDRRGTSNLLTAVWADANADLSAMTWSGTAWGNEPAAATETSLEVVSAAQDVDDFDVEYESVSGDVMLTWANSAGKDGTNGVRYRVCTGGTAACAWGIVTTPPTFTDDATNQDLAANPNTDEMVFASIGDDKSDMQIGYWSGSAWTNTANVDASATAPVAGSRLLSAGWVIAGSAARSVVVYNDGGATNLGWVVGNGSTFTVQTDFAPTPAFNATQRWYDVQADPINKDALMFTLSSSTGNAFAKRLLITSGPAFTWTNADGGAALGSALPQLIANPFSFAFWRQ